MHSVVTLTVLSSKSISLPLFLSVAFIIMILKKKKKKISGQGHLDGSVGRACAILDLSVMSSTPALGVKLRLKINK